MLFDILAVAFVLFWVWKAVTGFIAYRTRRKLWAGSKPITDLELLAWYKEIWWETYAVIDPADRVYHEPTPHWWKYQDHHFLPSYLGERLIGWWAKEQRCIFVTDLSMRNRDLIRHECAHDIMDSIEHSAKYFSKNTYVMHQFK
jgi:hypothetical protein